MKIKDILLGGLVLFSACLQSCQDDELISVSEVPQTITRSTTDAASGLTKNAEGYWVASRRVPLVGEGRMELLTVLIICWIPIWIMPLISEESELTY